jgi:hypothetical protein
MMANIFKYIIKKLKSEYGSLKGYGSCAHCGMSWYIVEGADIPYDVRYPEQPERGMSPVCTDCFNRLSVDEVLEYCRRLVIVWSKETPDTNIDFNIIEHNIRFMKGLPTTETVPNKMM